MKCPYQTNVTCRKALELPDTCINCELYDPTEKLKRGCMFAIIIFIILTAILISVSCAPTKTSQYTNAEWHEKCPKNTKIVKPHSPKYYENRYK